NFMSWLHRQRSRAWAYLSIVLTVLAAVACVRPTRAAAGIRLVKDINLNGGSSDPTELTALGSTLFFVADDGVHGSELWKSDGSVSGTALVKDINPTEESHLSWLTAVGTRLFFVADDGVHDRELWTSDGTSTGTIMLTDIYNFPELSYDGPSYLTALGNTL